MAPGSPHENSHTEVPPRRTRVMCNLRPVGGTLRQADPATDPSTHFFSNAATPQHRNAGRNVATPVQRNTGTRACLHAGRRACLNAGMRPTGAVYPSLCVVVGSTSFHRQIRGAEQHPVRQGMFYFAHLPPETNARSVLSCQEGYRAHKAHSPGCRQNTAKRSHLSIHAGDALSALARLARPTRLRGQGRIAPRECPFYSRR